MILRVKKSVKQEGVKPVIYFAIGVAYMVFAEFGIGARITSLADSAADRKKTTLHDDGLAVDLGARSLTKDEEEKILRRLEEVLDHLGFDVVLHGMGARRHYHIEFQPRHGENWYRIVDS